MSAYACAKMAQDKWENNAFPVQSYAKMAQALCHFGTA